VDALGDDVHRRQLLLTLAAGATSGSSVLRHVFDSALQPVTLTLDDWAAKVAVYGRDYLALNPVDLPGRLAGDLTLLQPRLDHPFLAVVSSKLLTLHGLAVQNTCTTRRDEVVHWYRLGVLAADHSGDGGVRVWSRGRAALELAYEGTAVDLAGALAEEALGLSDRESTGRLGALLGLAHARALAGDDDGARVALADARRVFDAVGVDRQVDDFVMSEWRLEMIINLLGARLGDERLTVEAQERAERALPEAVQRFGLYMELHRALMLVRVGDRTGGMAHAEAAVARNPTGGSSPRLLLDEIGRGVGRG
jgi:hypothetical protein